MPTTPIGSGLRRGLGPLAATALVAGTVIGSGIFKKPQVVAQALPFSGGALLVWAAGAILTLLGALAFAEVAALLPRAGGNYVFLREAFGGLWGFLWGWVELWVIRTATIAALGTVLADTLRDLWEGVGPGAGMLQDYWFRRAFTVAVIFGLGLVNVAGVRWGGVVQSVATIAKVGALLIMILLPVAALFGGFEGAPTRESLEPLWLGPGETISWSGVAAAVFGVLWAYHGWMSVAPVAEEVRQPGRNIPLALFAGVGLVALVYVGANLAYLAIIPSPEMAGLKDTTVAAAFCQRLLGPGARAAASAAVLISIFGALNGNIMAGPRVLFAMGEDHLVPAALARVHPRFHTPAAAILAVAAWASLLVLAGAALARNRLPVLEVAGQRLDLNVPAGKPLFDIMTDFAMVGAVVFETLAVATVFVFRRTLPDAERPYRCWGYSWVPAVYVVALTLIAASTFFNQRTEALTGLAFVALGALVYGFITRQRAFRSPLAPLRGERGRG